MLNWFVRSCVALLNKMLFVDLGVGKMFYSSMVLDSIMMESVFSFLPSSFSIIFLAKGKISKLVSAFLSDIGPKWCWSIRLQDFKSNISLEQSNEIVYLFTCQYQKIRVARKILGWCDQKWLWPSWSRGEWINEWTNWADFSYWCKFKKVKNYRLQ